MDRPRESDDLNGKFDDNYRKLDEIISRIDRESRIDIAGTDMFCDAIPFHDLNLHMT